VKGISHQWDRSLNWAWILLVGCLLKFGYTRFEPSDYNKDFYPWIKDYYDIPLMDHRNYFYLLGERFFIMVLFYIIARVVVCWQTKVLWFLEVLYIFDFIITFHASPFGIIKMIIMGIIFLLTLTTWKQ
jgi:hypothetical protein